MPGRGRGLLMRPRAVSLLPAEDGMAGGTRYELKLDGWRARADIGPSGARLVSRTGNSLGATFPGLLHPLGELPTGTVLDGEVVAVTDTGRMDFSALQRRDPSASLSYIAFDLLAAPGGEDLRGRPLAERVARLGDLLAAHGPQVQAILATTDRGTALTWYDDLYALGVEGIVAKAMASRYDPRDTHSWVKLRHAETIDAPVIGIVGSPARPTAVVVLLDEGPQVTTPRLTSVQAGAVAAAVHGRFGGPSRVAELDDAVVRPVDDGPLAEVRRDSGRHSLVRFVRLRPREV